MSTADTMASNQQAPRSLSGYGLDYEAKVSASAARKFVDKLSAELKRLVALPGMGREVTVAVAAGDGPGGREICLQNIGGTYVLASTSTQVVRWDTVFGEDFKPVAEAARAAELARWREAFRESVAWFFDVKASDVPMKDAQAAIPVYDPLRPPRHDDISDKALRYGHEKRLVRVMGDVKIAPPELEDDGLAAVSRERP